jgi:hypothetical protein
MTPAEEIIALYELRTYTLYVGKLSEAQNLYQEKGWPALKKHGDKLIGYFIGDVGALNQIIHLWRFDDDSDRRRHWAAVYADSEFMEFAKHFRPLLMSQENKLMTNAPWGPQA